MTEDGRKKLVGSSFRCPPRTGVYFPLQLSGCFNYGVDQGLLLVLPVTQVRYPPQFDSHGNPTTRYWFKVGAFSPDDLDLDLEFDHDECRLHADVVRYVETMRKWGVTYRGVLEEIRGYFRAGRICT
jgi:hypothetical protein